MMFRSPALLKLARGAPCLVAIEGVCSACHDAIDGRTQRIPHCDRRHYWQRGFERTILWLFENKHLRVIP